MDDDVMDYNDMLDDSDNHSEGNTPDEKQTPVEVDKKVKPGQSEGKNAASWTVSVDHEALNTGFDAPFTVTFEVTDATKKKNLVDASLEIIDQLTQKYGKDNKYIKTYKRWFCRNFDLPESVFNNPEDYSSEIKKIDNGIDSLLNLTPEVQKLKEMNNPNAKSSLLHERVPSYAGEQISKIFDKRKEAQEKSEEQKDEKFNEGSEEA